MPAKVDDAFSRGVSALFTTDVTVKGDPMGNVFFAWNTLATKFPNIYGFASVTHKARELEEKLMLFFKRNPRSREDREWLAYAFMKRMEHETAPTLEGALENWWGEIIHE